ncbi:MAG: cell division protein SepF [Clostridia bacterium]
MGFVKGIVDWVNGNDDDDYTDIEDMIVDKNEKQDEYSRDNKKSKVLDLNRTTDNRFSVVVVKPIAFENAGEIANNLKSGKTVALNFERTDEDVTRRLLDFLAGATYALNAELTKVSANSFIITPNNVDVSSDLVDELGNTGMF